MRLKTAGSWFVALAWTIAGPVHAADAQKGHGKHSVAEDVMDHRTMADAHRKAADCLESGKPEKECRAQLVKDCKGVAIGRHCGMKDRHKH